MLKMYNGINKIINIISGLILFASCILKKNKVRQVMNMLHVCLSVIVSIFTLYIRIACVYAATGFVMLYAKENLHSLPFTLQNITDCVQNMMFLSSPFIIFVEIIQFSFSLTSERTRCPLMDIKPLIGCLLMLNIDNVSYYLSPWLLSLLFIIFLILMRKAQSESMLMRKTIGVMKGCGVRTSDALVIDDFRSEGEIYTCAIHEAGHYVAAKVLSMEILSSDISLMIRNGPEDIVGGCVSVNTENSRTIDKMCLFYAGYAAQQKYETEHKLMYYCIENSSQTDFQNIAQCLDGMSEKERYDSYHACKELTNKLIDEHWKEILKTAQEFIDQHKEKNV